VYRARPFRLNRSLRSGGRCGRWLEGPATSRCNPGRTCTRRLAEDSRFQNVRPSYSPALFRAASTRSSASRNLAYTSMNLHLHSCRHATASSADVAVSNSWNVSNSFRSIIIVSCCRVVIYGSLRLSPTSVLCRIARMTFRNVQTTNYGRSRILYEFFQRSEASGNNEVGHGLTMIRRSRGPAFAAVLMMPVVYATATPCTHPIPLVSFHLGTSICLIHSRAICRVEG